MRGAPAATTDSDILGALLAHGAADATLEQAALELLPTVRGAFCLTFMDENTLYAARDPYGVRPLSLGRLDRGWVVASETAALDIVGASFVRDIEPGELLAIDADGVRSTRFANPTPKGCVFEYVYLARPDSTIGGRSVHKTRVDIGRRLAREAPVEADLVIGVPESGIPAAVGYAQESGIPYGQGLMKNAYVGPNLHPAVADDSSAGHPAEAEPAQRSDPRQAADRRRRLDRAGQHPARADPDAARGGRRRGARPDRLAAGEMAVLLRHRLRHPGRAHRQRPSRNEDEMLEAVRHAIGADTLELHLAAGHGRGHRAAGVAAVHGVLRRQLPDRAARRNGVGQERDRADACDRRAHRHPASGRQRQRLGPAPSLKSTAAGRETMSPPNSPSQQVAPSITGCGAVLLGAPAPPIRRHVRQPAFRWRDEIVDVMVEHHGVAFEGFDKRARQARRDRGHQTHPPTGDGRSQKWQHDDEPAPQSCNGGVAQSCGRLSALVGHCIALAARTRCQLSNCLQWGRDRFYRPEARS